MKYIVLACALLASTASLADQLTVQEEKELRELLALETAFKRHIYLAEQSYWTRDFEIAIKEYKQAFRLYPAAKILRNIAQMYEFMAEGEDNREKKRAASRQAWLAYERYLEAAPPDIPDRAALAAKAAELKRKSERRRIARAPAER